MTTDHDGKKMLEIVYWEEDGDTPPLYHHYQGQTHEQKAYLYLDLEKGTIETEVDREIGGAVTEDVWNKRTLRYLVSPYLSRRQANELMDDLLPLLQKVRDGMDIEWDGSNWVGVTTDPSVERFDSKIQDICSEALGEYCVWNAADYCEAIWDEHREILRKHGEKGLLKELEQEQERHLDGHLEPLYLTLVDEYIEQLKEMDDEEEEERGVR